MPRADELAERCEQATPEQQAELLSEAWEVVHGWPLRVAAGSDAARFLLMLNCEAYENAALSLAPEGWAVRDLSDWTNEPMIKPPHWSVDIVRLGKVTLGADGMAATPALALCAASLRARSTGGDGDE